MFKRIISILVLSSVLFCAACGESNNEDSVLHSVTVASSENIEIDGAVMTYFYNDNMLAFVNNYSAVLDKLGLDPTKPFDEQYRKNGEETWYDFFISEACTIVHYLMALNEIAIDDGIALSDAEKAAIKAGAEAITDGWYGRGVTSSDIANARNIEALAYKFENTKKAEYMPSVSEMEQYVLENETDFDYDESKTVNVRHILVPDSLMSSHEAAVKRANDILGLYESGEKNSEAFSLLALEYSNDPGSCYSGGLYENLKAGMTVEKFDEWCFDESRKHGDTAVIETEYGAHVMFFEGQGLPAWQADISDIITSEKLKEYRIERFTEYPIKFDAEALKSIG